MAVEKESTNQEDLNSFAHLLRTFLPDHDEINLNDTSALLGQDEKHRNDANAQSKAEEVQAIYEASNQSHRKKLPAEAVAAVNEKDPDIMDDTPIDKAKDPDFEPNSNSEEEEDEDVDSDATVEIPISELREACPNLVPKVVRERAARKVSVVEDSPHRMKWYACFICDDQYGDVFSYTTHMSQHCEEAGSIRCYHCGVSFATESLFASHRKLSTFELMVDRMALKRAIDCGMDIKKNEGKRGRKALREESYICNVCGKPIFKYPLFLKHVSTHDGAFSFQCTVCQEGFRQPCLLRSHIDLQHPHVLPYQCRRCLKRFKLHGSLATHLKTCDVDPSSLPYAQEMQFIDQLSQKRKLDGEDEEAAQYSCPICMVMYDSPEDLKRHMKHHDEMKPYKCEICGRGFRTRYMLQKHTSIHNSVETNCHCEICGVELLTRSGYNAHLRGHRNQEIIQAKILAEQQGKDETASKDQSETPQVDKALKILQSFQKDNMSERKKAEREARCPKTEDDKPKERPKNFACPMCGLRFHSSGEKFQAHCRKEHKDAEFLKCDVCNKLYYGQNNLDKHRKCHKLFTDTFPCDECEKVFRRKFALQVHKKMHSFKKFVKCDICGQEFRFVSEVDKHKNKKHRYDRLLNIYKCNICGQRFPVLSHLSVHCYCHNQPDSTPFECDLCNSAFKTSIELKQHIFQKHEYLMKSIGDSADIPENLSGETKPGEIKIKTEPMDEDDPQVNSEPGCSTTPSPSQLLQTNGKKLTQKQVKLENSEGNDGFGVAVYNLTTLQFSHKSKILKRYNCEVCQKAFASNSDLKTHRRTHSGETPFKCDFCDRSFKQRGHRKLHIQVVHTKEMPYKCTECDAAFPTRYRFQIHMKRHSGVRDYKCVYCEKEFYTLGKMNDHMKRRHPVDWKKAQLKAAEEKESADSITPPTK
ncbi:Zinc finger protein 729 [Plakobranchus ocellatus]|uniref:Zinc finger protein 729 n=1 Tax=Plakobranchus ocellatus TaxID=259542 RepID=A0AAV3XYI2_9GAST|nr:Zinc finger protein 729 [Plakobranchus ocellatus]